MTNTDQSRQSPVASLPAIAQRRTKQRQLITDLLASSDQLMSAQEIHQLLRQRGESVGLATVYRTLASLAETGQIDAIRHGQEVTYRRCSPTHHHHLVCRSCNHTVEIDDPPLEDWASKVAASHGFAAVEHLVDVIGLCPACQSN